MHICDILMAYIWSVKNEFHYACVLQFQLYALLILIHTGRAGSNNWRSTSFYWLPQAIYHWQQNNQAKPKICNWRQTGNPKKE